jgi:AcrR family transcriptional regulator
MDTTPTADGRTPYHHGDLHNALIQAGLAILTEEGAHALSLRAVARRVGVSHAAPYRHFADKDALLAAIAEQGFLSLAAAIREAARLVPTDPTAQLADAGWAYVQFALQRPAQLRLMFSGVIRTPQAYPQLRLASAEAFSLLVGLLRAGQQAEVIRAGDSRQLALAAWALVHGVATLLIEQQIPPDIGAGSGPEWITRMCGSLLYTGLRSAGAASGRGDEKENPTA